MNSLRRKVDRLKDADCFRRRQTFLATSDCASERGFKRGFDPAAQVQMMTMTALKKENPFEENDVDIAVSVSVPAICRRGFLHVIHPQINAAILPQRLDQGVKHFVETKRVFVEMLGRIVGMEANVRQI